MQTEKQIQVGVKMRPQRNNAGSLVSRMKDLYERRRSYLYEKDEEVRGDLSLKDILDDEGYTTQGAINAFEKETGLSWRLPYEIIVRRGTKSSTPNKE